METPSSTTRRLTRSQALMNNIPMSRKVGDFDNSFSKSRQRTTALTDITNDSPIIGLAMAKLETPSSAMSKNLRNSETRTHGSGEALLRGQVKSLLQKVEEEAEYSKFSLGKKQFLDFQGFLNSPMALLAPTPANTPQIENVLGTTAFKNACLAAVTPSPVQEQLMISQMVVNGTVNEVKQDGSESEENVITRSLFFDFSDKSDGTTDSSSVWSLQVNTSAKDDDDEEQEFEGDIENEEYDYGNEEYDYGNEEYDYENEDDDGGLVDELCEGINRISVNGATKFAGKHTKFIYNSDGEIEVEECGFQTPKEKHLEVDEDTEY